MEEKTVHIPAISCGHCIMTIERELTELAGISSVRINADTKMVTVKWRAPLAWDTIQQMLYDIGYPPKEMYKRS